MNELIEKLRNILSGFMKKETILPFEGMKNPSRIPSLKKEIEESPVSEEEALNRANDFIKKAQQLYEDQNGSASG